MELETDIKVLDHGYVRYQGHFGSEEDIIRAARMSTGKGFLGWGGWLECTKCGLVECDIIKENVCPANQHDWQKKQGDEKLLEYLYSHKHMTPFEMCELRFEVKAPIMVFREWATHRTQAHYDGEQIMTFNEMSARYIQMPNEHYVPEIRMQDTKNKQGSILASEIPGLKGTDLMMQVIREEQNVLYENYNDMVSVGVAKEVARINTPVSRYSKMWVKANLRNWLQFLDLRLRKNAQLEIRLYAQAIAEMLKFIYPRTYALFEEHTLHAVTLSRSEVNSILSDYDAVKPESKIYQKLKESV